MIYPSVLATSAQNIYLGIGIMMLLLFFAKIENTLMWRLAPTYVVLRTCCVVELMIGIVIWQVRVPAD
jgi:hypothetical protein